MQRDVLRDDYFKWLSDIVCKDRFAPQISHDKLLSHLHKTEFTYMLAGDENRAKDGIDLRARFALDLGYEFDETFDYILETLDNPCSVLEMMIALAFRCEEFMNNTRKGDRTQQWFWNMIVNLGLGGMTDDIFENSVSPKKVINEKINKFLNREYERDGYGGLFTIRDCDYDLRTIEIWTQLCWYLDTIA